MENIGPFALRWCNGEIETFNKELENLLKDLIRKTENWVPDEAMEQ